MRRRHVLAYTLGAYLVVVGFLGGVLVSAIRYDAQRDAVLAQLEDASTRVRAHLMRFEPRHVEAIPPAR